MTVNIVSGTSTAYNAKASQVTGSWESAAIQWSNMPTIGSVLEDNISHNNKTKYQFSCLTAVQHWYDGSTTGQNENYGIMLQYADSSIADYNSFYSADCTDATMRPAMTISYQLMVVPMDEISVQEGFLARIPTPTTTSTITWTSSNMDLATVDSDGVVTGIKAGKVTITASVEDVAEYTYTVYVKIKEGARRVYCANTSYYLSVGGGMLENAGIYLKNASDADLPLYRQVWKIYYLEQGYYVIRPLHNQNMALYAKDGECGVSTIGSDNYLIKVPEENRWTIEWLNGAYVFKCQGDSAQTLRSLYNAPEVQVYTGEYMAANNVFQWNFSDSPDIEPELLLLDAQTGVSQVGRTYYIDFGKKVMPADLGIIASVVYFSNIDQRVEWFSNSSSVTIDKTTGEMMCLIPGERVTINAEQQMNGSKIHASFTIFFKPIPDGTYFMRCCAYDRYMQIDNRDSANDFSTSGAKLEQWAYHGTDFQKWTLTWRGNGYYSITSVKSGMAVTVPSGQTGSSDVVLVQEPYTGNDRQLWQISVTEKGCYIIKAKSSYGMIGDLVMTVGDACFINSNGITIKQCLYTNDDLYNDEWFICSLVNIGMSTDDYTDSSVHEELGAYYYATLFSEELPYPSDVGPFSVIHHYNKESTHTASPNDFAVNGAISDAIDFMIYIGHGHSANSHTTNGSLGNHLHFDCELWGTLHSYNKETEKYPYCNPAGNVYTKGVRFGSDTAELRWVWLYTCHFLATNEYVTDNDLKEMMKGAHITMGYATQSYLCEENVELFGQYLREGMSFIEAFFEAGQNGEAQHAHDNHLQRVIYIPQALHETIFSPMIHFDYDPSDVLIVSSRIMDANI